MLIQLHAPPSSATTTSADLQALADERRRTLEERAFERGRACGLAELLDSRVQALEHALEQLDAAAERAQAELTHQAVELAVEIARHLLQLRVEAGDYDLERIVRGALGDADVGRGAVTVHLNPLDHEELKDVLFRAGTTLEVDPSLPRGDLHLLTARGLLVRDTQAALDSICEQLLEDLAR